MKYLLCFLAGLFITNLLDSVSAQTPDQTESVNENIPTNEQIKMISERIKNANFPPEIEAYMIHFLEHYVKIRTNKTEYLGLEGTRKLISDYISSLDDNSVFQDLIGAIETDWPIIYQKVQEKSPKLYQELVKFNKYTDELPPAKYNFSVVDSYQLYLI